MRQTTHVYGVWHVFAGVYITFLSLRLEEKETLKYCVCAPPSPPQFWSLKCTTIIIIIIIIILLLSLFTVGTT